MKFIVLVEGSASDIKEMVELAGERDTFLVDTNNFNEEKEYKYLLDKVRTFSQSNKEIMLAKVSGRESVIKNLGDECPEMIVSLSYNKNSEYFTECPVDTFLDLINIFE